jgi:hypothetical protein
VAIAYDNTASTTGGGGGQPYTASHTIAASGNNRILVAVFFGIGSSNAASKFTSVQYNGVAPSGQLTPDTETNRYGNYGSVSVYYWLESDLPANGTPTSYNVTATSATGQYNGGLATISFTGASQATPEATGRNTGLDATSSSVSVTSVTANDAIVDAVGVFTGSITGVSPTAGQTEVQDIGPAGGMRLGLGYELVTTAQAYSQTWSWTPTSSFDLQFGLAIAPAGAANTPVVIETGNLSGGTCNASFNHTLTGNANRLVLVYIDDESTSQATGVTYDGVAMTQIVASTSTTGAGNASSIWGILDADLPTSGGTYAVSVSGLDSGAYAQCVELSNVSQVIPSGSAIAHTETGAVTTTTATATAPAGNSMAVGCAGHGQDGTPFNNPPSGTGTWTRLSSAYNPPSSCYLVGAYQAFTTSGSKSYTETVPTAWNRASQCLAIFAAFTEPTDNAIFFGTLF